MKKLNLILALMLLISGGLLGCGSAEQDAVEQVPVEASTSDNTESANEEAANEEPTPVELPKLNVVTSFFPLHEFARIIGGDLVSVTNLVPAGVEPHDWTPKSQDMTLIAAANLLIYQGAGFETWTEDVLNGFETNNMIVIEASQGIELIAADSDDHGHEDEHAHEDESAVEDAHDHGAFDPHTWLSPKSAIQMAENIFNGLKQAAPDYAPQFEQNYNQLVSELQALDGQYQQQLTGLTRTEIVVSHKAFGYLTRDYGLTQLAMMGISAEAEPTAQDLKKISQFVKEHQIQYIFTEQLLSDKLARTLADDLGVQTLLLHTLEGLTQEEMARGETYISLMETNLKHLVQALK
jgi:zinc transport system substrate-binding protein